MESFAEIFEMLWNNTGLKVEKATVEKFCFDEQRGYCGTFDIAGKLSGNVKCQRTGIDFVFFDNTALLDLKTSKEAQEKHFLQLGAYFPFVKPEPFYGLVVCLCPYTDSSTPYGNKNPNLIPRIYVLDKETLIMYRDRFYEMLREWWIINGNC